MTETDTTELSLELKRRKLKIKELKEKKKQRDYEKLMEVSLESYFNFHTMQCGKSKNSLLLEKYFVKTVA